jgi:hypothetical protein
MSTCASKSERLITQFDMKRIVIERPKGAELADEFRKALNLLCDGGYKPRSGTKLLSRYAVIMVDDDLFDQAVAHLRSANMSGIDQSG